MKVETSAEQFMFLTLRIETPNSIGTGFIISHEWIDRKSSEKVTGFFLISNKHVIHNTNRWTLNFTRKFNDNEELELGIFDPIEIKETQWIRWMYHPSDDIDVAALPLTPVFDSLPDKGKSLYFKSISTSMIPNANELSDLDALEDVIFVGYPYNIYDTSNNLPIFRKGITATAPNVDYEGKPMFLIDASVFPGSSGSPVFIYNSGPWRDRNGLVLGNEHIVFLGVLASVLFKQSNGKLEFIEIPTTTVPIVKTNEMIDLGIVYKSRTVLETIEHGLRLFGVIP